MARNQTETKPCVRCKASYCGHIHSRYCDPCYAPARKEKGRAHATLKTAISRGIVPAPNGVCVDCGSVWARTYDHRDYSKPLDVELVCFRCNLKRGPATWPNLLQLDAPASLPFALKDVEPQRDV